MGLNISKPNSLFPTDLFAFGKSGREKNCSGGRKKIAFSIQMRKKLLQQRKYLKLSLQFHTSERGPAAAMCRRHELGKVRFSEKCGPATVEGELHLSCFANSHSLAVNVVPS